jgi:hypothetical protein
MTDTLPLPERLLRFADAVDAPGGVVAAQLARAWAERLQGAHRPGAERTPLAVVRETLQTAVHYLGVARVVTHRAARDGAAAHPLLRLARQNLLALALLLRRARRDLQPFEAR